MSMPLDPPERAAPRPGPPEPDLAEHYAHIATERHLKAGKALAAAMRIPKGASVLDLGSGTGWLSEHLADLVGPRGDVLGLDPSPYHMLIAHQRSRPNLRFQVGSPFELARFPRACFDAIVVNGLLHTWAHPEGPLEDLHRLLAPGGCLGIVTPRAERPHPVLVVHAALLGREPYVRHPQPEEARDHPVGADRLRDLLRGAGFESIDIEQQPDEQVHPGAVAAVEWALACNWGRLLDHLPEKPENLRQRARDELVAGVERLRTGEGIRHRGIRLQAVARLAGG